MAYNNIVINNTPRSFLLLCPFDLMCSQLLLNTPNIRSKYVTLYQIIEHRIGRKDYFQIGFQGCVKISGSAKDFLHDLVQVRFSVALWNMIV